MDLIYANSKREDIGVIEDYTLDLAFGKDENDFECRVSSANHVCRADYLLYEEGSEYGGIIDKIGVDTKEDEVIYSGRTWHGILEGKIIEPDSGADYYYASGEANEVLRELIERVGLSDLFTVSTDNSGITIIRYPIRYEKAYTAIRKMLFSFYAKIRIVYEKGKVKLAAVPYVNYGKTEDWDSSQMVFSAERNYRPVNHLICLGSGNLKDRHVIHLFTDANGAVLPYTKTSSPLSDADYILDKSQQALTGEKEVTETYDYPNAADTDNYVLLTEKPDQWDYVYGNYYSLEGDKYKEVEMYEGDIYTLQKQQPYDWEYEFKDYYKKIGSSYVPVDEVAEVVYNPLTSVPYDWEESFAEYFYKDGDAYKNVEPLTVTEYNLLTKKPSAWSIKSHYYYYKDGDTYREAAHVLIDHYEQLKWCPEDWETNYSSYYFRDNRNEYYQVTLDRKGNVPEWNKWDYFEKFERYDAPEWSSNTYYEKNVYVTFPAWAANMYYEKGLKTFPTWATNSFYTKSRGMLVPSWAPNVYYEKRIDHFAELVAGGLENLQSSYECDSIDASLDPENVYDIGDIVGATDDITGLSVYQPITKKVVTVKNGKEEISYEIGD